MNHYHGSTRANNLEANELQRGQKTAMRAPTRMGEGCCGASLKGRDSRGLLDVGSYGLSPRKVFTISETMRFLPSADLHGKPIV